MAYIPQPKDVTSYIGSGLTPQAFSGESMFQAPSAAQQQGFNPGATNPIAGGMPQKGPMGPPVMAQPPQPPMPQPMGGAGPPVMGQPQPQNNDILSFLSSMFNRRQAPMGNSSPMLQGLFNR